MRKRDLLIENERLKAELGFLRGQVEQLQKAPGLALDAATHIVEKTLAVAFPANMAPEPESYQLPPMQTDWSDDVVSDEDVNALTILESQEEWAVEALDLGGEPDGG